MTFEWLLVSRLIEILRRSLSSSSLCCQIGPDFPPNQAVARFAKKISPKLATLFPAARGLENVNVPLVLKVQIQQQTAAPNIVLLRVAPGFSRLAVSIHRPHSVCVFPFSLHPWLPHDDRLS